MISHSCYKDNLQEILTEWQVEVLYSVVIRSSFHPPVPSQNSLSNFSFVTLYIVELCELLS